MYSADPDQDHLYTADVHEIAAGAFIVDETLHVVAWNEGAEQLLGYPAEAALGRKCFEVLAFEQGRKERFCATHCPWVRRRGGRSGSTIEFVARTGQGQTHRVTMTAVVARSAGGRERVVHILLDPHKRHAVVDEVVAVGTSSQRASGENERVDGVSLVPEAAEPGRIPHLSSRELEVLGLLAQGHTPREIAAILRISRVTVRNHMTHVMEKLGVRSRLQAIVVASRMNLL
jgi:PAS domain S-box-containing protein